MDKNPLSGGGGKIPGTGIPGTDHGSSSLPKAPSSNNSNFSSMPNDGDEQAFKVPGFGKAEDEEKKGLANRFEQGKQISKELASAASGKSGGKRPNAKDDPLTTNQRQATDTAVLAARGARAALGDERALKEMAEHPLETAKEAKNASKFLLKVVAIGCAIVIISIMLMFAMLSNFSQQHVSQVIKDRSFTPIDVTGARRVSQIFSETMFGNEKHFDVLKVLTNLGEEERIRFFKGNSELSTKEFIESQNTSSGGIVMVIGSKRLTVPANISNTSSPETIEFIKRLEITIKSTNLMGNESRIFRSPSAKQVYKQFGINLFRWENEAKDVKTYSDNMKTLYESIKDTEQTSLKLKDVDDSGKQLDAVTLELLDKDLPRSQKSVAIKTADIAWDKTTGTESLNKYAQDIGETEFAISAYCTAKSYIDNYEKIVTQKFVNSQRAALKLLSSDDQVMVGKVNPKAVSSEAQQIEFFEDARPYLQAINADVTNRRPTLNEGQLAYQDPRIVKAVMEGIRDVFEKPFSDDGAARELIDLIAPGGGDDGGVIGKIPLIGESIDGALDIGRDFMLDRIADLMPDKLIGFIADRLYPVICKNLSVPGGVVGNVIDLIAGKITTKSILEATRNTLLENGAYELANQLGLSDNPTIFSTPTENFMKFMYRTQKTIEFAGLDDGAELVSKDFEGVSALSNELSRIGGGRMLDLKEQLALNQQKSERNYAVLKDKPLSYRLFSLSNQYSPISIVASRSPKSINGATKRTQSQVASIFSPVKSFGGSINKAIAAKTTTTVVAQSLAVNDKYDRTVMIGYSVDELKKMHEDISFWPKQNKIFVEENLKSLEKAYGECFNPQNSIKILHDKKINVWEGDCSPDKLKGDDMALHYRLYLLDNMQTNSLTDLETVTQDSLGKDSGSMDNSVGGPLPSGEAQDLAKQILDTGNFSADSRYRKQIEDIANGKGGCNVNPTILSLLLMITQKYSITVSSINRFCTNKLTDSGEASYHWRDGGGHAVDISVVNGVASSGATPNDLDLLNFILPSLPSGSGIGQSGCRSKPISLPSGVREFSDTCNHIHIQVPVQ